MAWQYFRYRAAMPSASPAFRAAPSVASSPELDATAVRPSPSPTSGPLPPPSPIAVARHHRSCTAGPPGASSERAACDALGAADGLHLVLQPRLTVQHSSPSPPTS